MTTSTERVAVIHIGTHKTGTTTQQFFLMQHADELAAGGLYFPKTGWYGVVPGHHALAWEVAARDDGPILKEFIEEVEASDAQGIVLSAEDFSLLYSRPHAIAALANSLQAIGYTPKMLVYLRAQGPFAESMYVERIKHGRGQPIDAFLNEIVETGRYAPPDVILPIEYRYSRMIAPYVQELGPENVCVRTYEGTRDLTRVFTDFINTLCSLTGAFKEAHIDVAVRTPVINESLTYIRLLGTLYTQLRPHEDVPETALEFRNLYAQDLPVEFMEERFALLQRAEYQRIMQSVAEDNAEVERLYGARVPFSRDADIPSAIDPIWAKALIERRVFDRCYAEWSKRTA